MNFDRRCKTRPKKVYHKMSIAKGLLYVFGPHILIPSAIAFFIAFRYGFAYHINLKSSKIVTPQYIVISTSV